MRPWTTRLPGLAIVAVFVFAGCRLVNELHPAFCPPAGGH
jgi:hypothetical protein